MSEIKGKNHIAVVQLKALGYPLDKIRKALHKLTGITQPEMAEMIGTSRINITNHISGRGNNLETQARIAEIWDIPIDELFKIKKIPGIKLLHVGTSDDSDNRRQNDRRKDHVKAYFFSDEGNRRRI